MLLIKSEDELLGILFTAFFVGTLFTFMALYVNGIINDDKYNKKDDDDDINKK